MTVLNGELKRHSVFVTVSSFLVMIDRAAPFQTKVSMSGPEIRRKDLLQRAIAFAAMEHASKMV